MYRRDDHSTPIPTPPLAINTQKHLSRKEFAALPAISSILSILPDTWATDMPMAMDHAPDESPGKIDFLNRQLQICADTSPFDEPSAAPGVTACTASDPCYGSKQLEAALDLAMMKLEFTLFAMQNPAWLHISKEFLIEWYLVTCRAQGIQPCTRSVQDVLGPVRPPPPGSSPAPPPLPPPKPPASPTAAASPNPVSTITSSSSDKISTCRRSLSRIPTLAHSSPATPTAVTPRAVTPRAVTPTAVIPTPVATRGPRDAASSSPAAPSPILIPSPCASPSPSPSCTPCSAWSACSSSRSSASSGAASPAALRRAALGYTLHSGAEEEQAEPDTCRGQGPPSPQLAKPWASVSPAYSCDSPAAGHSVLASRGSQRPATAMTRCSLQWPSPSRFGSLASRIPVPPDMATMASTTAPPAASRLPSTPSKAGGSGSSRNSTSVNILVIDESMIISSSTGTSPTATRTPETQAPFLAYSRCSSLTQSSSPHIPANPAALRRGSSIPRSPGASPTSRFRTSPVTRSTSSLPSLHQTIGLPTPDATTDAATTTSATASTSVTAISLPRSPRLRAPDALAAALAAAEEALLLAPLAEACEGWEAAARQDAEMADLGGLGLVVGVC